MLNADIRLLINDFIGSCRRKKAPPLIVLLGPTASGKTALSIEIAKHFNGEIISADSRQVYRHMDIGTDKIPPQQRAEIPHHLLDIVNPDERFTVVDFKDAAETAIDDILSRGKVPILAGGTGLYIRAITQNFSLAPENPKVRAELLNELKEKGTAALYKKLCEIDPQTAAKIQPQNAVYIVRALEVCMTTGKQKRVKVKPPRWEILTLGLKPDREVIFERIHERIDEQIERGLKDEAQKLLVMGYSKNLPSMTSLGYREMIAHLEGALTLAEAKELIEKNTRNLARRQMTWFKKDTGVVWIKSL